MIDWIAAAMTSTKAASDIAKSLLTLRDEEAVRSRVFDLTSSLMELQQQMMTAQREQMALIDEVADLKDALKSLQAKSSLLDRYELLGVGPGKVVYALTAEFKGTEPEHFCCTNCYDSGKRSVFRGSKPDQGWMRFVCPACKYGISIETIYIPAAMYSGQ
jgi:cell division protein FtsB